MNAKNVNLILIMKKILLFILLLVVAYSGKAQLKECKFTHYTSENGLSQNTVMYMLQDHEGFLWFATWDGINKFDGYNFTTYKARSDNRIPLTNNRIDWIGEDRNGYIWILTYDNRIHRFNPQTETMEQIPGTGELSTMNISSMKLLGNGVAWLVATNGGAIRVSPAADKVNYQIDFFSEKSPLFPSHAIHNFFLDSNGKEWMLTDSGLAMFNKGQRAPVSYFAENINKSQAFYTACELGNADYFGSDKGRIWKYIRKNGHFELIQLPTKANITGLGTIVKDELVAMTAQDGFYIYNTVTGKTQSFSKTTCSNLPEEDLKSLYVDSFGMVWFEVAKVGKVCYYNSGTKEVKCQAMQTEIGNAARSNPAFHIHEDINHMVWVQPYGGGFSWFDRAHNSLIPFYDKPGDANWRFSDKIHSALSDNQGNLWLCTHSKGLEKISFVDKQFQLHQRKHANYETLENEVRSLFQDKEGHIWSGQKNGFISIYDRSANYLGYLTASGTISQSGTPVSGVAYCITQDRKGVIWIGTKGDGLIKVEKSGTKYKLTHFLSDKENIYSLSDNDIYNVYEDSKGRLWIATFGGGINYIEQKGESYRFINYRNHLKNYPISRCYRTRFITEDHKNNLWVGTTTGVLCFKNDFRTPEDILFHSFVRKPGDMKTLSNNDILCIYLTSKNELFFSTFGGLNKLVSYEGKDKAQFKSYNAVDGFPSDVLLSVEEDKKGILWISTENGLCKFDPRTEKIESYNDYELDMDGARFNEATSIITSNGLLLFGTNKGFLSFNPLTIRKSSYVPKITFSKLLVANRMVVPGDESGILKRNINDTNRLELSHKDNIFTVFFSALDMRNPANIKYAYQLEGFDKDWQYVDDQRSATYTNLPKGQYVLHVKSTNSDGVWVNNERILEIEVLPSFWETPWAYMLYILVTMLLLFITVYILFTIYRLKHEVSVEQQISDIKLRFFTNISHELRTPLTLIAGPVDYVLKNNQLPDDARDQLKIVERNTDRMLRLVNQILDIRKIQNHKMKLRVQQVECVSFVHHIMDDFQALASEHNIDFLFESELEKLNLWVDADKLEKIIFNLLSNAFKYTPQGKMITVFIHDNDNSVAIGVQDQGIGIPENKRASLFVRFENLLEKGLFNQESTGIGLSLVKELAEMHKATIDVQSKPGEGSCFTVNFLKGKEHYDSSAEFILGDSNLSDWMITKDTTVVENQGVEEKVTPHLTMLLVEDNLELRFFIKSLFISEYKIYEAANGMEGYNKAIKFIPDVIISDVMMPEMDGIEMTKEIRNNLSTSHIPIILLTAKTTIESRLEGLEKGADDYLTKPFSASYLKARVDNLLSQRDKLREIYTASLMNSDPTEEERQDTALETEMSGTDKKFMDKLMELMMANMDNGNLVVDDLVRELAVSRSVFFKKLKFITGLAPIEFIKEIRIKRAAQLIESGDYNMTQISYMVGINDPRYFSKCFKKKYGKTPTEYKDGLKKR